MASTGPSAVVPCLCCPEEPRTAHSVPDAASAGLSGGAGSPSRPAGHSVPPGMHPQDTTASPAHKGTAGFGSAVIHQDVFPSN